MAGEKRKGRGGGGVEVNGVTIEFPFRPYTSQIKLLEALTDALSAPGRHALLESPTGTGKTLCLLCGVLGWRGSSSSSSSSSLPPELASIPPALHPLPSPSVSSRLVYMSRTHGQLTQVVRELRASSYRPRMAVLGSRQQLCIHPEVSKLRGSAQNAACSKLVGAQACGYYRNVSDHKHERREVVENLMDIEDLCKHGTTHKVCPYYLSRDLSSDADVVFMPYNYLTDPASRKSLGHLWKDSVVVIDEAHNMETICSDASSFDISSSDIAICVNEVDRCIAMRESNMEVSFSDPPSVSELEILKHILLAFEKQLDAIELFGSPPSATRRGEFIFEMFSSAGVNLNNAPELCLMLGRAVSMLMEAQGSALTTNPALKTFADAVEVVFKPSDLHNISRLYRVFVSDEPEQKKASKADRNNLASFFPGARAKRGRSLGYWCFSAGVTMREIVQQGVRNIVLASGTLSPMTSWSVEMEMKFDVVLENEHVICDDQIFAAVLKRGPRGTILNSSYRNKDNKEMLHDLGNVIVNTCRIVPDGVLVFFPSYTSLTNSIQEWQDAGIWDRIARHKHIFVEPRESANFKATVTAYTEQVDKAGSIGAVLMAVCRGKMSEGIDFADRHGRAVIVTGLPFPALLDPKVVLKRSYMDEVAGKQSGGSTVNGEKWYVQQAARAVNQAIGRVIRHKEDFGAILLCDERFAGWTRQPLLSRWVQGRIEVQEEFGPVNQQLAHFFQKHRHSSVPANRPPSPEASEFVPAPRSSGQMVVLKSQRVEDRGRQETLKEYESYRDLQTRESSGGSGAGLSNLLTELEEESPAGGFSRSKEAPSLSLSAQLRTMRSKEQTAPAPAPRPVVVKDLPVKTASAPATATRSEQEAFLLQVKQDLGKERYQAFRKAMTGLKEEQSDKQQIFQELFRLFSSPDKKPLLQSLFAFLSRKLQTQFKTFLDAKQYKLS